MASLHQREEFNSQIKQNLDRYVSKHMKIAQHFYTEYENLCEKSIIFKNDDAGNDALSVKKMELQQQHVDLIESLQNSLNVFIMKAIGQFIETLDCSMPDIVSEHDNDDDRSLAKQSTTAVVEQQKEHVFSEQGTVDEDEEDESDEEDDNQQETAIVSAKAIQCSVCNKRFKRKYHMRRHVELVHEKIRAFECNHCGRAFGTKWHMLRHVKCVHDDIKDYDCKHCDKAFARKDKMQEHERTHLKRKLTQKAETTNMRTKRMKRDQHFGIP